MQMNQQPQSIRILALGDSYSIGTGVNEEERWPMQLAAALRMHGLHVSRPSFIAQNGWTTSGLLAAIPLSDYEMNFGLVTMLIGVNNQYQGLDIEEYDQEFNLLLKKAVAYASGNPARVIVLSIPDWGVTPFAAGFDRRQIASEIDAYNRVNRRLSNNVGVHYVDITPLSRQIGQKPANLADDGLHPSGKMYAAWVELVLPVALRAVVGSTGKEMNH